MSGSIRPHPRESGYGCLRTRLHSRTRHNRHQLRRAGLCSSRNYCREISQQQVRTLQRSMGSTSLSALADSAEPLPQRARRACVGRGGSAFVPIHSFATRSPTHCRPPSSRGREEPRVHWLQWCDATHPVLGNDDRERVRAPSPVGGAREHTGNSIGGTIHADGRRWPKSHCL